MWGVGQAELTWTISTVDSCAHLSEFVLGGLDALSYRAADVGIIGIHRGTVTTGRRECSTVFECVSKDFGLHAYFRLAAGVGEGGPLHIYTPPRPITPAALLTHKPLCDLLSLYGAALSLSVARL